MNQVWALYLTALALGAGHALEVDHMVAVTAFVGGRPHLGTAVGFGVRWGVGHSLAVLVAGTALALSGLHIPPGGQDWAELGVGVMLVALGVWAANAARRLHVHLPQDHAGHAHLHAHPPGPLPTFTPMMTPAARRGTTGISPPSLGRCTVWPGAPRWSPWCR